MDGARLETKVFAGFAKAASRIGRPFDIYRPISTSDAIAPANKLSTLPAAFTIHTANNFDFTKPSDYDKPLFHALIDPTQIRVGDYLNDPATTAGPYFVASITSAMPVLAVACNRVISLYTPGPQNVAEGLSGYGGTMPTTAGNPDGNETAVLTNWPASLLMRSRSSRDAYLPADTGSGMFRCLIPAFAGVHVRPGSIIVDDLANRFAVQVAELQDLGWRLDAQQMVT